MGTHLILNTIRKGTVALSPFQLKTYRNSVSLIAQSRCLSFQTQESRQVTHLQFTSWPDYGIPPSSGFLDFLFRVRACQADAVKLMEPEWQGHPLGPPIVVHCSAGIGRTGE